MALMPAGDQAGVPPVHPPPGAGSVSHFASPRDFVDIEDGHWPRLVVEGGVGDGDGLIVDGVPSAPVLGGHRAVVVEDTGGRHRVRPRGCVPRRHRS
ncbi:hypothetical protein RHRU231_230058 [Rhodococcus ruber]|uniref:Uncharacterized protein n=1 Tax=Rhodococcus ruber TaxID=1830 RepID=A0A098BG77_9NOCA|nr:hypothetical protein RHRU231_230058 [Rhodococcus ruber]